MRQRQPRFGSLLLLLSLAAPETVAAQRSDASLERARGECNAGSFEDCARELETLRQSSPSAVVAAELGLAYQALGRWSRARPLLEEALGPSSAGNPWIEAHRAGLTMAAELCVAQLGSLAITSSVDGSEILVGGEVLGATPLRAPILLDPGVYTVEVRAPAHQSVQRTVEIGAGQTSTLTISPTPIVSAMCTDGRIDTGGHCCWPEQSWSVEDQICAGEPSCPTGLRADGLDCRSIVVTPSDSIPVPGGEFILSFGVTGFSDRTTALWRPDASDAATAYGGGFGTEIDLGFRPVWFLSAGVRLLYGISIDGYWYEGERGANIDLPIPTTFHAASAGVYLRIHTAEVQKPNQVDLWFGTGFMPAALVFGQHGSPREGYRPDASVLRAFSVPAQMGLVWYPAPLVGLHLMGGIEFWIPQEYQGEEYDTTTGQGVNYGLGALELELEYAYQGSAGFSFAF